MLTRRRRADDVVVVAGQRLGRQKVSVEAVGHRVRHHAHQGSSPGDDDLLGHLPHRHREVHGQRLAQADADAVLPRRPHPGEAGLDGVAARRQRGEAVVAALVGDRHQLPGDQLVRRRGHGDAGQPGAVRVCDDAPHAPRHAALGAERGRQSERQQDQNRHSQHITSHISSFDAAPYGRGTAICDR